MEIMYRVNGILAAALLLALSSCYAQLRFKNSANTSYADQGYSKYEMVMGTSRWKVLDLKNGSATDYKNIPDDGLGGVSKTYVEVFGFASSLGTSSNIYDFRNLAGYNSRNFTGFQVGSKYTVDINGYLFTTDN